MLIALAMLCTSLSAQSVFWQDDFENATTPDMPASSIRTASFNGGTTTSYFKRSNNTVADITLAALFGTTYGGMTGSFIWAGEDHDGPTGNSLQQIEWTGIAITGRTSISFRGNFAANNQNGAWDNVNTGSSVATFGSSANTALLGNDHIMVEYAINAAAYTPLISFWGDNIAAGASPTSNKSLNEDTNGDFIGDGLEPGSITLTQFIRNIPGTGTTMRLRLTVYCNGANEEWAVDNFRLFATVLPVEWTHFELAENSEAVQVTWGTATEVNSDHFAIERSADGVNFAEIGRVGAAGNSASNVDYAFSDASPESGKSYYRIRQVDLNGDFVLSEALEANFTYLEEFVLYPNPAKETMSVMLATDVTSIKIFGMAGDEVNAAIQIIGGVATLDVSSLANGMYFTRIDQKSGSVIRRFVVQR